MAPETKNETNPIVQNFEGGAPPYELNVTNTNAFDFSIDDCAQEKRNLLISPSGQMIETEVCLHHSRQNKYSYTIHFYL